MAMNLRADSTFVEDNGWHGAKLRYDDFIRRHSALKVVFLELGVGYNTPVIIKYPFWNMTARNPKSTYICLNCGEAAVPDEIRKRAVCIDSDIGAVLSML